MKSRLISLVFDRSCAKLACANVLSRRQANYHRHVEVDYLDYDEVHYFRFGRGEKQLAR